MNRFLFNSTPDMKDGLVPHNPRDRHQRTTRKRGSRTKICGETTRMLLQNVTHVQSTRRKHLDLYMICLGPLLSTTTAFLHLAYLQHGPTNFIQSCRKGLITLALALAWKRQPCSVVYTYFSRCGWRRTPLRCHSATRVLRGSPSL